MYATREVFPSTPLALVVAEVRFTDSPRLRQQETLDAIAIALEEHFPYSKPHMHLNIEDRGPGIPPQVEQQQRAVLTNAASTESLTITSSALIYETTAYREFDGLCTGVAAACDALIKAKVHPALLRVGLRYINEIRVPETIVDARDWSKWIDSTIVGVSAIGPNNVPVRTAQGTVVFDLGGGNGLNFQYAALDQAPVVQPQLLKRRGFEPGPFFVLDFDGYHEFNAQDTVPLVADEVAKVLVAVHDPAGEAFQRAITEDSRILFRGETA
jgi:uncharacterized protein (TIGR04255 family)